jgi:hypothetical protein
MKTRNNENLRRKKVKRAGRTRKGKQTRRKRLGKDRRKTMRGGSTEIISIPLIYIVAGMAAMIAGSTLSGLDKKIDNDGGPVLNIPNPLGPLIANIIPPGDNSDKTSRDTPKSEQPKSEQPKSEQPKSEQPKSEQPKSTGSSDNNYAKLRDRNIDMIGKKYELVEMVMDGPGSGDKNVATRKDRTLKKNQAAFESAPDDNGKELENIYSDLKKFIASDENNPDKIYEQEIDKLKSKDMSDADIKTEKDKIAKKRDKINDYLKKNDLI